jgi:SAM-dependent methyltransferase
MPTEEPTEEPTDGQPVRGPRGRSFGAVARAYAAFRPGYPEAAVDWALAPVRGPGLIRVLDLAAGTGQVTAALLRRTEVATPVVAVEPDPEMLAVLGEELGGGRVITLAGTAEDIPLPDTSVDAVLVGQAFHWFEAERAGAEIARVLRPGGVLAGLWNAEDGSVSWVAGYNQAAARGRRVAGVPQGGDQPDPLPADRAFAPQERAEFGHSQRLTVAGLVDVLGTHSWALLSTPEERETAFGRIRDYFATRPDLFGGDGSFELPLRTRVLRAVRLTERR